jgi:KUP system potassium uptake protein
MDLGDAVGSLQAARNEQQRRSSKLTAGESSKQSLPTLVLVALGIVFGDIGTSPLYTIKEVFGGPHAVPVSADNVLGILSLIFWALVIVVSIKYVALIMRANNKGEGGILALTALALRTQKRGSRGRAIVVGLGLVGAALFYGDGVITPAITVLSAVEGMSVASPAFEPYIVPIALVILVALFSIQRFGTATVGLTFGPIMCVWFVTLGILGMSEISANPSVLAAMNPIYAVDFLRAERLTGVLALGAVVLAITGAEALYADMGHFGLKPIRVAWYGLALPCLLLNYFGQGALVIAHPESVSNPFYLIAPKWALTPLVVLATVAAIIASQAVISGAYSLTKQAVQFGYLPRMNIKHTSEAERGQVYVPFINWAMLATVVVLVLGFQSSSRLASAYGINITAMMLIALALATLVARMMAKWSLWRVAVAALLLFAVDFAFFSATAVKIPQGGWFPMVLGLAVATIMMTWKRGRELLGGRMKELSPPLRPFLEELVKRPPLRVEGTAVFMNSSTSTVPTAMLHNLKHNKVLHERVVFLTVRTRDEPHVDHDERVRIEDLGGGFWRVIAYYGFMETPNIPRLMEHCADKGLPFEMDKTSFFLGRESLLVVGLPGMSIWRERLYSFMQNNATKATDFFQIPPNRVVELGTQVEI